MEHIYYNMCITKNIVNSFRLSDDLKMDEQTSECDA